LTTVAGPLLVWLFAEFCIASIEKVIHYQRLREVFWVLQTAYEAFGRDYKLD